MAELPKQSPSKIEMTAEEKKCFRLAWEFIRTTKSESTDLKGMDNRLDDPRMYGHLMLTNIATKKYDECVAKAVGAPR